MNILVIGSGGREHALCWAIAKSPKVKKTFVSPGNGGTNACATNIDLDLNNHNAVIKFCNENDIELVVVGPEQPLVNGMADDLREAGIKTFGPSALAARLEGSKAFTKDLCAKYDIPTASYGRFKDALAAKDYVTKNKLPIVIKADGLAAGKGVIIAQTQKEAFEAIDFMFDGAFGDAGTEVVIEEFMEGEEASFFCLVNGEHVLPFGTAQDHKRVGDGDVGPNTGGMGAYSPAPVMSDKLTKQALKNIVQKTASAMVAEGCPFQGVLYAGLMLTNDGPKLIEYNCRFGDPECQVLMQRLDCDFVDLLLATVDNTLENAVVKWLDQVSLTIVYANNGYPNSYKKGSEITGIKRAQKPPFVEVFHAGTIKENGKIKAVGGRVLNITALGKNVTEAAAHAYDAIQQIKWSKGFYRKDIGWRAIERE